jgi:hypothetical protein
MKETQRAKKCHPTKKIVWLQKELIGFTQEEECNYKPKPAITAKGRSLCLHR